MSLKHAVLGVLAEGEASGYDLVKLFNTSLANAWPATQSQIYTELTKLADAELITVSSTGPRGRKQYAITDAGRAELRYWITETPSRPDRRSEALLRVFFLGQVEPAEATRYLAGLAERAQRDLAELRELRDRIDWDSGHNFSRYGRIALEFGLRLAEMRGEWARWAEHRLDSDE